MVACSDGRLQRGVDDFLEGKLGVRDYDRIYLPGGPGALASSGVEYVRSDLHRKEFLFLLKAHEIKSVVLLFHGPAEDGPELSACADYVRCLGTYDRKRIEEVQLRDYEEIKHTLMGPLDGIDVVAYRCEVMKNLKPQFVGLD